MNYQSPQAQWRFGLIATVRIAGQVTHSTLSLYCITHVSRLYLGSHSLVSTKSKKCGLEHRETCSILTPSSPRQSNSQHCNALPVYLIFDPVIIIFLICKQDSEIFGLLHFRRWSCSDRNNENADTNDQNEFPWHGGWAHSLRWGMELRHSKTFGVQPRAGRYGEKVITRYC